MADQGREGKKKKKDWKDSKIYGPLLKHVMWSVIDVGQFSTDAILHREVRGQGQPQKVSSEAGREDAGGWVVLLRDVFSEHQAKVVTVNVLSLRVATAAAIAVVIKVAAVLAF